MVVLESAIWMVQSSCWLKYLEVAAASHVSVAGFGQTLGVWPRPKELKNCSNLNCGSSGFYPRGFNGVNWDCMLI